MVRSPRQSGNAAVAGPQPDALQRLRKQWLLLAFLCLSGVAGGYAFLGDFWEGAFAVRWALGALIGLAYLLWKVRSALPLNRREAETELLATFGTGTLLTTFRGYLIVLMVGFLLVPSPPGWIAVIPALLYSIAALMDIFDGYFARRENQVTPMGQMLDLDFDGLGVLVACLLGVQYGQLPVWFLPVGLARYLFALGIALLKRMGRPVYDLTPSLMRRVMATLHMGFMSVILYPVFAPPATTIAATVFMTPMLAGFLRDWLVVSGSINPEAPSYQRLRAAIKASVEKVLPVIMRLMLGAVIIWQIAVRGTPTVAALTVGALTLETDLLVFCQTVFTIMIFTGLLGRLAALISLMITAGIIAQVGLDISLLIACIAASIIVMYGTGPFSLWKPEDSIFRPRSSEQA